MPDYGGIFNPGWFSNVLLDIVNVDTHALVLECHIEEAEFGKTAKPQNISFLCLLKTMGVSHVANLGCID